jgi:hypothetical protein
VQDILCLDILIHTAVGVGLERAEVVFLAVVEEVGRSEADAAGDGERDSLVIPPMLQPILDMCRTIQPTANPLQKRRRNSCKRSLLLWKRSWVPSGSE